MHPKNMLVPVARVGRYYRYDMSLERFPLEQSKDERPSLSALVGTGDILILQYSIHSLSIAIGGSQIVLYKENMSSC